MQAANVLSLQHRVTLVRCFLAIDGSNEVMGLVRKPSEVRIWPLEGTYGMLGACKETWTPIL